MGVNSLPRTVTRQRRASTLTTRLLSHPAAIGNMHKNLVKIGRIVLEICSRTDKYADTQTDRHAHRNTAPPTNDGGVIINIDKSVISLLRRLST